jgi:Fe-S cluster assembly protein SufD
MAASKVQPNDWFQEPLLRELSSSLGEPPVVLEGRREAFGEFVRLPVELNPLYKQYAYFGGVDLRGADPMARGHRVRLPPEVERTIVLIHDVEGTLVRVPPELSTSGVQVETVPNVERGPHAAEFLGAGQTRKEKFISMNSALFNRGVLLTLPDGLESGVRVQDISVLSEPSQSLLVRRVIRTGRATKLCYSEEVYSTSEASRQRLYSSVVHAVTGPDSQMVYLTVHAPDPQAISFYAREASTGPGSKLGWVWSGFGGLRTNYRNETHLAEPGSEVDDLQTLYGDGECAYNNFVEITHHGDDTRGQSITRGVFKDRSRGTSRGMMRILSKTQKVVSYLAQHGLLLSKTARCETAPDLEILSAKDVKATHSSSVAPIDPEKIFYLESRGIPEPEAKRVICEGFLSHVLDRAPVDGLREVLYPTLDARWTGRSVYWVPEGTLPSLPPLKIVGWGEIGDWRLDTKLRDTAGRA